MPAIPELRLSPSGIPASNLGYHGMMQRLAESEVSCATLAVTTANLPIQNVSLEDIIEELENPSPTLSYRVRCRFWLNRINATSANFVATLQVRYTVGGVAGSWQTLNNSNVDDATDEQLGKRQFELIYPLRSGASSPAVPADCELMEVRCVVLASGVSTYEITNDGGSGLTGGRVNLQLSEHVS